jgi:1,4-dihydroxy-6-naphthoate synthase
MSQKIALAISTCPNDTFAFHGIIEERVDLQGLDFDIQLLDIQQLNDGLFQQRFDVAKASFHAAAILSDRTKVLPSGSALGFGVGPLLLSASNGMTFDAPTQRAYRVLCPGQHTTATMLFRMFYADAIADGRVVVNQKLFSDIMPALQNGEADFGVCIHEGRFTWQDQGLGCVEDLGTRWEKETTSPLPLGGILVAQTLIDSAPETVATIQDVIQSSILYGQANPEEALTTMRTHAQEFEDDVLMQHVQLYVNDWTLDLGAVGQSALEQLSQKAKAAGIIEPSKPNISVWK